MTKIAQNMAEQNETMLAGIQAAARYSNMGMDGEPLTAVDEKVDFVARNRVNVGVRFTSTACRCCVVACGKKRVVFDRLLCGYSRNATRSTPARAP